MNTAVTGVYAGLIGIACLGIVAALFLVICNMYKCRFLLYFTCCILILVGIVCLFLAIIISALLPIAYFTCDFTTTSFSSAAGFNGNYSIIQPTLEVWYHLPMLTIHLLSLAACPDSLEIFFNLQYLELLAQV
jgi:hypothetical protein